MFTFLGMLVKNIKNETSWITWINSKTIKNVITWKFKLKKVKINLVINIPRNGINLSENSTNGYRLRTTCINSGIPLITNVKSAMLLINSLKQYKKSGYTYKSWNEYVNLKKIC